MHLINSLGSILVRRHFRGGAHTYMYHIKRQILLPSYRVPIYTPGWRAAMWIKCLGDGQECQAFTGIEPATLWSRVKASIRYKPLLISVNLLSNISLVKIFGHNQNIFSVKYVWNPRHLVIELLKKMAPKLWNNLPQNIRSITDFDKFKSMLKTHLFDNY